MSYVISVGAAPPCPPLTGVGFLRLGSIKSIKPGENKGDSTKHVAGEKPKMLKNKHLKDWSCIVSKQMPHLSIPQ
ncbi:hypothetical protein QUA83_25870, partial [Microcoleus sp. K1-B1]|uniref:hypothetical protein n=1 Tax=Microcoleus sp. K1-B1 TaxID=2818782 RepID=UPI002FD3DB7F